MDVERYIKLFLSISTTYYWSVSLIAPNPILKSSGRAKLGGVLESTHASGQHMCMCLAVMSFLLGFAEVSSILVQNIPNSALSKVVRWVVLFKSTGHVNIYLTKLHILGATLVFIGGSIRLWTYRALGKFFTFQIGVQKNQKLMKHGLYSIVRHPSYTAMLFFHPGFVLWHLTSGSWVRQSGVLDTTLGWLLSRGIVVLMIATTYMICINRPPQEDKVMKEAFGREWEEWAKEVPYRILPGIY